MMRYEYFMVSQSLGIIDQKNAKLLLLNRVLPNLFVELIRRYIYFRLK